MENLIQLEARKTVYLQLLLLLLPLFMLFQISKFYSLTIISILSEFSQSPQSSLFSIVIVSFMCLPFISILLFIIIKLWIIDVLLKYPKKIDLNNEQLLLTTFFSDKTIELTSIKKIVKKRKPRHLYSFYYRIFYDNTKLDFIPETYNNSSKFIPKLSELSNIKVTEDLSFFSF